MTLAQNAKNFFKSKVFREYLESLRYSFYTMRRPLDGFWDLIHEKRGSIAAANTFVILAVIIEILRIVLTGFQFNIVFMEVFNAYSVVLQVVVPVLLWTVANWCLTTLFDGKGKMSQVYMGIAYAYVPIILINVILIPLSHILTFEEGAVYFALTSVSTIWFVLLLLCAMKEIHDYTFFKTIVTSLLTIFAIGVILFIFMMFFAVVSEGIAYFYAIYQELLYR